MQDVDQRLTRDIGGCMEQQRCHPASWPSCAAFPAVAVTVCICPLFLACQPISRQINLLYGLRCTLASAYAERLCDDLAALIPTLVKPVVDITWFSWQLWRLSGQRGMLILYLYTALGWGSLRCVCRGAVRQRW
jgi:hypothetical protein